MTTEQQPSAPADGRAGHADGNAGIEHIEHAEHAGHVEHLRRVEQVERSAAQLAERIAQMPLLQRAALLGGASQWTTRAFERAGVPSMVLSDGPHGVRRETGDNGDGTAADDAASNDAPGVHPALPATCFPTASLVACSWDPQLASLMGAAIAVEARAQGVNVLLGPGMNIKRSPRCGRNFEYYAEDPQLAGRMAAGFIAGVQSQGVAACPKHFAANSQELRRQSSDSIVDERTLRELYLTAFEIAVRAARPWAIMSAYNRVNGVYAFEHPHLLRDLLRDEWGFDGMVVSDWGASNDAVAAVAAGGSLEMPCPGLASAREIVAAVRDGRLDERDVTARATEVAACAARTGAGTLGADAALGDDVMAMHHRLAMRVAEESMVLLRNEPTHGHPTLPLAAGTRVALVGDMALHPRIQGSGSSRVNATRTDALAQVLESASNGMLTLAGVAQGYCGLADAGSADGTDGTDAARAEALIREACALAVRDDVDVVVACVGLDDRTEAEGVDRATLAMPQGQNDLMAALGAATRKAGKPLIVVLTAGSPVLMPWADSCDALLAAGLAGQAGASAVARLLSGLADPRGRLAETWPLRDEDVPVTPYPADGPQARYEEGMRVGYRHYVAAGVPVRYPFGFGLAYTQFAYRDLAVDSTGAQVTVTNAGERAGTAVPQLYVAGRAGDAMRELRGFAKIRLEPGESARVNLPFDRYTFRRWDDEHGMWRDDAMGRTVIVGEDCCDARLQGVTPGSAASAALRALEHTDLLAVDGVAAGAAGDAANDAANDIAAADRSGAPNDEQPRFTENSPFSSWAQSRSIVARWWARRLERKAREAQRRNGGMPDLDALFTLNMPPRALAKLSDGAVDAAAARSLARIPNRQAVRGLIGFGWHVLRNRVANWRTERELARLDRPDRSDRPDRH